MPRFTPLAETHLLYYTPQNSWHSATKFNSKDRVVTQDGKNYTLFSKFERQFGSIERTARFALGALLCAVTLGFTYRYKSIQKLLWKDKAVLRIGMLVYSDRTPFDKHAYFIALCRKNPDLQHYFEKQPNTTIDKQDFARFLTEKSDKTAPIELLNAQDLRCALQLISECSHSFDCKALFTKWAATGHPAITTLLLKIDPLAYTPSSDKSYFIQALLSKKSQDVLEPINEIRNEAKAIFKEIATPTEDEVWYHQAFADLPFDEEAFQALSEEKKRELFYVANIFGSFSFAEKTKPFLEHPEPIFLPQQQYFTYNMDIVSARDALNQFISELKENGGLLKRSEFSKQSSENFIDKDDQIDRILGRNFADSIIKEHGFKHVKVPKKIVVVENDVDSLCLAINRHASLCPVRKSYSDKAFTVYAEKITQVQRRLSLDEAKEFALALEYTGYNDFAGQNFIVAKDGIYFIDTEYHNFTPRQPAFTAMYSMSQARLATDDERNELKAFVEARKTAFDAKKPERDQMIASYRAVLADPLNRLIDDLELSITI